MSPCPILLMLSASLGNDKYQFCKSARIKIPGPGAVAESVERGHHMWEMASQVNHL